MDPCSPFRGGSHAECGEGLHIRRAESVWLVSPGYVDRKVLNSRNVGSADLFAAIPQGENAIAQVCRIVRIVIVELGWVIGDGCDVRFAEAGGPGRQTRMQHDISLDGKPNPDEER